MSTLDIRRKYQLLAYAREHAIKVPAGFDPATPVFGHSAQMLTRVVQNRLRIPVTGQWSAALARKLPLKLTLVQHDWQWAHPLGRRIGTPPGVVWHHAAGHPTVEQVHQEHLANGWAGIGYHRYVTCQGIIHAGRPLWAMGAHTLGHNDWLGVCAEGNYEVEQHMPARQLVALQYVHTMLHRQWAKMTDRRHKDLNPTACPGRYYPYSKVIG